MSRTHAFRIAAVASLVAALFAPQASAAASCVLSGGELSVVVIGDTQDTVLARSGDSITVDGAACGGATVSNTDLIVVEDQTDDGGLNLHVDLSGGDLAPGLTPETGGISEIEISFNPNGSGPDYDAVVV